MLFIRNVGSVISGHSFIGPFTATSTFLAIDGQRSCPRRTSFLQESEKELVVPQYFFYSSITVLMLLLHTIVSSATQQINSRKASSSIIFI